MVTKFVPLPATSGGRQRSLAILQRLAATGSVTLCAFDDGGDRRELARMGVEVRSVHWKPGLLETAGGVLRERSISAGRFFSRRLAAAVSTATREPTDLLMVEYGQLAPYGLRVPARLKVWDLHNVESDLAASFARTRGPLDGLPFRIESANLRRLERRALAAFDVTVVVSDHDRGLVAAGAREVLVCPNGCEPAAPWPPSPEPVAVFVALLSWPPNADAARWLARAVWPTVRRQVPEARLVLVGRDPPAAVQALAADDIQVTGTVEDVSPYLARARVALAPLRAGGGSRLKILEALNAGRPVVATSKGVEGLEDLRGDGVEVADDPAAMAGAVAALLTDGDRAAELGRRGHAAVVARYSWDRTLAPLLARVTS